MKILVIHGPNLNMLGIREPEVYGRVTLDEINEMIHDKAKSLGVEVRIVQHSSEGAIVDEILDARSWACGIVINPAAYSHYSIAIRDALATADVPAVEVHLSNIYAREVFRRRSVVSGVCTGVISGLGAAGYLYAMDFLALRKQQEA